MRGGCAGRASRGARAAPWPKFSAPHRRTDELKHVAAEGAHQGHVALAGQDSQVQIAHLAEHLGLRQAGDLGRLLDEDLRLLGRVRVVEAGGVVEDGAAALAALDDELELGLAILALADPVDDAEVEEAGEWEGVGVEGSGERVWVARWVSGLRCVG